MTYNNQRIAYGETLVRLGRENPDIVALEADLGKSTMSFMFQESFPERYFEMGIAEANMTSTAAGLAQTGKIPFTHSFAVFSAGRAYDQIRQTIAIGNLNVKICGSSAGLSDFGDGSTHQAIEDMAIMRAIPNMTVLCPADANETVKAVEAMVEFKGPCYIRLNRNNYENVTAEDAPFAIGVPTILREGTDVVVFACGIMVGKALAAAEGLKEMLSVKVVNVSTVKPLDVEKIRKAAAGCKGAVTAEEHSVIGGLGSAVAQALADMPVPVACIGVEDEFGCSSHDYEGLLAHYGLTTDVIVREIRKFA
ncbi:transketolase family protein [Anaerotalea alkaliphila]|uniref:Transketolase family protein n=1 Tax=Anaerotalea alkaliphila TaxID=2662126 RepID=A0A7X5HV18_9FIRM|nr:transketolase C-terminal domain-containing protein [Anaerotalea alkaliphila]NDL67165.1 transketolase family protein [Anaerotalea alkaliphila]